MSIINSLSTYLHTFVDICFTYYLMDLILRITPNFSK